MLFAWGVQDLRRGRLLVFGNVKVYFVIDTIENNLWTWEVRNYSHLNVYYLTSSLRSKVIYFFVHFAQIWEELNVIPWKMASGNWLVTCRWVEMDMEHQPLEITFGLQVSIRIGNLDFWLNHTTSQCENYVKYPVWAQPRTHPYLQVDSTVIVD